MEQRTIGYPSLISRVVGYLSAHRRRFSAGIALTMIGIIFEIVKPWPLKFVLDDVLPAARVQASGGVAVPAEDSVLPASLKEWLTGFPASTQLAIAALAIVIIAGACGGVTLASNYLTIDVGQRAVNDLRTEIYSHLQKLSLKFHYKQETGDLLFRVMSDTFSIQSMVMNGMLPLLSAAITLISMFWIMVGIDWSLALVALVVCPPLYVAIARLNRIIHGHATASREAESRLYSSTESTIGAVKLVQAYGREDRVIADFRRGSEKSLELSLRLYNTQTTYGWVVDSVLALGTAGMVWLGAHHVLRGQLTIGELFIFLSYLSALYKPIQDISFNLAEVSAARAGLERVFAVLDVQPDIQDSPTARPLGRVAGEVAFERVTFGYDENRPVLSDVSLRIKPGEKIALVGRTGAGKSTLASLVMRFFDPQQGRVLIDGHDLRDVTLASLRAQITLMLQEPILFHTTVAENLAWGSPDADLATIEQAARQAEAHEFIENLPQGYSTVLGDDGLTLSGGQRQRLALARALLRNTPIVILDEPTSSLDLATESSVWRNVEKLLENKTAIIIAHRLTTARMADRIIVLHDNAVVEQGPHEQLLAERGMYWQLWQRHSNSGVLPETDLVAVS